MRQQSLAEMALQEDRVVIRQQESWADETGICPGDRLANADSAAGTPGAYQQPQREGYARTEHTYGGPLGRRSCTLLLYPLFDLFELRF